MSKGVAVPYIIALIIGVLVLGVLGYWFFSTIGKSSNVTDEAYCRGKLMQYCGDLNTGKSPGTFSDYSKECSVYIGQPGWPTTAPDTKEKCQEAKVLGF